MDVAIVIAYELVKIVAMIHVLMDNRQPAKTMAWMLVIYFVPVVGLLFYFFFGLNTRRERLMSERSLNQLTKRSMLEFVEQRDLQVANEHRPTVDLFVNQVRKELAVPQEERKPSVMEKLKAAPAKNSPKISANSKGQER